MREGEKRRCSCLPPKPFSTCCCCSAACCESQCDEPRELSLSFSDSASLANVAAAAVVGQPFAGAPGLSMCTASGAGCVRGPLPCKQRQRTHARTVALMPLPQLWSRWTRPSAGAAAFSQVLSGNQPQPSRGPHLAAGEAGRLAPQPPGRQGDGMHCRPDELRGGGHVAVQHDAFQAASRVGQGKWEEGGRVSWRACVDGAGIVVLGWNGVGQGRGRVG